MSLLNEFIEYLKHEVEVHSIYVIGAQGQRGKDITETWIKYREQASEKNATRAINFWKKQCAAGYADVLGAFDCSGLGMYWLQQLKKIYPSDLNANGMYSKCSTKLTKDQLKKGDWVFVDTDGRKTHIGYIVDDNLTVIESRGRDYGVVAGPLDKRWTHFGRPDVFKEEIEEKEYDNMENINIVIKRNLKTGTSGDDVKALQIYLNRFGAGLSGTGTFSTKTNNAVIKFQKENGLTADGIAGKNTITKLGMIWGKDKSDDQIFIELNDLAYKKTLEADNASNDSSEIESLKNQIEKLNSQISIFNIEILNKENDIKNLQNQVMMLNATLTNVNKEKAEISKNLNDSLEDNKVLTDKLNRIDNIIKE